MRRSALFQFSKFESKGEYRDIQIELDAILDGDVDAINIKSSGSTEFTGNVIAKEARLGGVCKIGGNCNIDSLNICGESIIGGNIVSDSITVDGKLKCSAKLIDCRELNLSGKITLAGEIKADILSGEGGLVLEKIEGNNINLNLDKKTILKEIKGKDVNIIGAKSNGFISKVLYKGGSLVEINTIYGDNITLENINAKLVKGHNINIGENCSISKVEYTGEYKASDRAKVEMLLKV